MAAKEDDGSMWATVDELPGCFASGFGVEELHEALVEAIQLCLPDGIKVSDATFTELGHQPGDGQRVLVCA